MFSLNPLSLSVTLTATVLIAMLNSVAKAGTLAGLVPLVPRDNTYCATAPPNGDIIFVAGNYTKFEDSNTHATYTGPTSWTLSRLCTDYAQNFTINVFSQAPEWTTSTPETVIECVLAGVPLTASGVEVVELLPYSPWVSVANSSNNVLVLCGEA